MRGKRLLQSKLEIYNKYGVDVYSEDNTVPNDPTHNDELVTHNYVYYRNNKGEISLFSWVNNIVVQDIDNYFARKQWVCKKCGTPKTLDKCPKCGREKLIKKLRFHIMYLRNSHLYLEQMQVT